MREVVCGIAAPEPAGISCKTCNDRGYVVIDIRELDQCRLRWQWADIDIGINDCPRCRQRPQS
jgi:hypothetical protein